MQTQYSIKRAPAVAGAEVRLLLNGKFDEEALPDLALSLSEASNGVEKVYIDLSEVTLVDRKAVQFLSDHASTNVLLVNCPTYLRRWIKEVSDVAES